MAIRSRNGKGGSLAKDPTFDRRKYPRVRTEAVVSIAQVEAKDVLAQAVDLSLNGIRFQCVGLDVVPGELLRVTLNLDGNEVSAVGKLVRVTDLDAFTQELALTLIEVDARTLELLRENLSDFEDV